MSNVYEQWYHLVLNLLQISILLRAELRWEKRERERERDGDDDDDDVTVAPTDVSNILYREAARNPNRCPFCHSAR